MVTFFLFLPVNKYIFIFFPLVALRSEYTSIAAGKALSVCSTCLDFGLTAHTLFALVSGSECVDKMYAGLPDVRVPLNVFSSWEGLNCHIKLTSAPGTIIRLTVDSLDIEPSDCIYDALTVYDALLPMRAKTLHRSVFEHR